MFSTWRTPFGVVSKGSQKGTPHFKAPVIRQILSETPKCQSSHEDGPLWYQKDVLGDGRLPSPRSWDPRRAPGLVLLARAQPGKSPYLKRDTRYDCPKLASGLEHVEWVVSPCGPLFLFRVISVCGFFYRNTKRQSSILDVSTPNWRQTHQATNCHLEWNDQRHKGMV